MAQPSQPVNENPARRLRAPALLLIGAAAFLIVIVYLVASSMIREAVPTFAPSPSPAATSSSDRYVVDTATIDASDGTRWHFFDLARGSVVQPPDTAGWDLAFQRFRIIASGAVADLGAGSFDSVLTAPKSGYVQTTFARDTVNDALDRWYRYNFLSHQLTPNDHVYVLRTLRNRYAKLQFLSYYCTGRMPGCITLRYGYQGRPTRQFR